MQMWGADGTPLPVAATRWRDMEWSKAAPRRLDRLRREISTPLYKLSTCFLVWCKMAADNSGSVTIREIMTDPRELADSAAYLHREGDSYFFSPIPTLNSLAAQKAAAFPADRVDTAIVELLAHDARTKGSFARVHAAPEGSSGVEDECTLGLVILPPTAPHIVRPASETAAFTLASSRGHRSISSLGFGIRSVPSEGTTLTM